MPSAAQLFYLAVFSLLGHSHASSDPRIATRSSDPKPNVCAFEPSATVSDACASYSTLDDLNAAIDPHLKSITQNTDFFSYYRLNLYNKVCPFWSDENGMCGNIACAVNTLENEDEIPPVWRAKELGKLEGPKAQHPGRKLRDERKAAGSPVMGGELGADVAESCVMEPEDEDCDERDYCILEDEADLASAGDYVSLVDNPERFTGYGGPGSQQVWESIYMENCFSKPTHSQDLPGLSSPVSPSLSGGFGGRQVAALQGLRSVMRDRGVQQAIAAGSDPGQQLDALIAVDDECIEKRVFYRVISGMHASISTHLCSEYLNQSTGEWGPNLACYEERLHKHPERISNLYFNYALLLRAVRKARTHVRTYSFCSTDPAEDARTKKLLLGLADALPDGTSVFDESTMFQSNGHAPEDPAGGLALKEDFRARFRNVSRIMDCVGCDKCRLWGKLQTQGYGTALKVLFEFDEQDSSQDPPMRRTELVALVNTLDRVSHSLSAIKEFERMIEEREGFGSRSPAQVEANVVPTPHGQGNPSGRVVTSKKVRQDEDEEDDGFPEFLKTKNRPDYSQMSASEIFWHEYSLVWRTAVFVVKGWIELPGKLWRILISEIGRLWDFWLGLPVQPRSWRIRVPRDEL